jgi:RNA 3'-terminal phosphate cyclase (ATP)
MIKIDGSHGEGGGQILRSTLTLSAILGKPVEIFNIRAGRKKPGLQPQHLTGVRAVAQICNGKLEGDDLFSQHIIFHPGKIQSGNYEFDVMKVKSSAGSTGMILQQIAPVLAFGQGESNVILKGGTHTEWAPPIDYLQEIFIPTAAKMGFKASLNIERWGWYPIGQGIVNAKIQPVQKLKAIELNERGELKRISAASLVSRLPLSIAERERDQAFNQLKKIGFAKLFDCDIKEVPSLGTGNYFALVAEFENSVAGFSSLGKIGKRAEKVADEAVDQFVKYFTSRACIEKHLGDQLILYMALSKGKSSYTAEISNHILTNIWVMEQFLPVKFIIHGKPEELAKVEVDGMDFQNISVKA